MFKTFEGRKQAAHHQAAWISARSHAISIEKFCGREKFSKFSVANRTQSPVLQHADARHSCWGPLRVVSKLRTAKWREFRRDLTRFSTKKSEKFCGPPKFSKISVAKRMQSHAAQHADARHSCWGPLRVVSKLRTTRRHGYWRVLTRFRTKNCAAAKNFRKFRSEIARNLTRHSMCVLGTNVRDL